jgi:hypothetical protein
MPDKLPDKLPDKSPAPVPEDPTLARRVEVRYEYTSPGGATLVISEGTDPWIKIATQASLVNIQRDIATLTARWPGRYRFLVRTRNDTPRSYELYLKHRTSSATFEPSKDRTGPK